MLRLDLTNAPRWLDMPGGVRIQCLPYSTEIMIDAQADPEVLGVDPELDDRQIGAVFSKAIARRVIIAWEEVGDLDGTPIEPSPKAIDQLMSIWPIFEAFQEKYISGIFALSAEGNVSTPLLNGSSAGARNTARAARSRAKRARAS